MSIECETFKPQDIDSVSESCEFQKNIQDFLIPDLFRSKNILLNIDNWLTYFSQYLGASLKTFNNFLGNCLLAERILELFAIL